MVAGVVVALIVPGAAVAGNVADSATKTSGGAQTSPAAYLQTATGRAADNRPAAPASPTGRRSDLRWKPCPQDKSASCATLRVPVDWTRPYGPQIGIALARRPATEPRARIGTLVVNPGGPGGSGVDLALYGDAIFSERLRRHFDIVGFDPRGVGRSAPIRCTAALVAAAPSPLLTDAAAFTRTVAYNRKLAADCRRHSGPIADHADTLSVVRDLEALRAALAEPALSFYGASYGTLIAAQYAERYPRRVRAFVLDSAMDHSVDTAAFMQVEAAAVQDSFDEFVAWCARDKKCALRGRDVRALWARLLRRAEAGKLADPIEPTRRLGAFELKATAFGAFYGPDWYALAHYLDSAASSGPTAGVGSTVGSGSAAGYGPAPAGAARRRASTPLVDNPFPAVFCADWRLPVPDYRTYRRLLDRMAQVAPDMRISPLALSAVMSCAGRPGPVRNPQASIRRAADYPVLIVNARHDPATAHRWATGLASQFGTGAVLVTYEGWGHVAYGRSRCITAVIDDYLVRRVLPTAGTSCPGVPPEPFGIGRRSTRPAPPDGPRPGLPGWAG